MQLRTKIDAEWQTIVTTIGGKWAAHVYNVLEPKLQAMLRPYLVLLLLLLAGCAPDASAATGGTAPLSVTTIAHHNFVGAFFRPQGAPPYGVFSVYSKQMSPEPYPSPRKALYGPNGYCDAVAANGVSISSGYLVDAHKLANIVDLGVRWVRMPASTFFSDRSHFDDALKYDLGQLDSAQCAVLKHHIDPVIELDAGPVQYNLNPEQFSPKTVSTYKTAADFATWCSVITTHEKQAFPMVHRFSLPGNEVNSNQELFPGGDAQIASYARSCYKAVKAVEPGATVYGFELNEDRKADPTGFVQRLYDLGCRVGSCYDALSVHLSLRYPLLPEVTPCFPNAGGDYGIKCIDDVRAAAHAPIHIIIGETGYFVPGNVHDEVMKAAATVAEYRRFAERSYIDGVVYANVDECDLYPSGYFFGGCLVDSLGNRLPAFAALQKIAASL